MPNIGLAIRLHNAGREKSRPARAIAKPPIEPKAGLADKTVDAGTLVRGGRIDSYWGKVNLDAKKIGVDAISAEPWKHDPERARERFNLRSIEFGNWVSERERQHFLYGTAQGLHDLAKILGISDSAIGLTGNLSIALGARGSGHAKAHYERYRSTIINLTRSDNPLHGPYQGKDSLAHEYGHALDNMVATGLKLKTLPGEYMPNVTGGRSTRHAISPERLKNGGPIGLMEQIFQILYWKNPDEETSYSLHLKKQTDYFNRREEVWARTFETWVSDKLTAAGILNAFLAKGTTKRKWPIYPSPELINRVDPLIRQLLREAFKLFKKEPKPKPSTPLKPSADEPDIEEVAEAPIVIPEPPVIISPEPTKSKTSRARRRKVVEANPITPEIVIPSRPQPTDKSINRGAIAYGESTIVSTRTEEIPARYAIVELKSLIASHDAWTFAPNKNYPGACQQRDYTNDKSEQQKVITNAKEFRPRFLLSTSPTAADGAPIVNISRIVLGGNSRVMTVERLEDYDVYRHYLSGHAGEFGINPKELKPFDQPFLIREVDVDMSRCAACSNMLNKSLTQELDITTETISYARQLTPSLVEEIASRFEQADADTISGALNDPVIADKIVRTFRTAGIITPQNVSQWLDPATKSLSDLGRLLVEKILLAVVLSEKKVIDAARSYTSQIIRTLPLLLRLEKLPVEWHLTPDIVNVIQLETKRRTDGTPREQFIHQMDAFSDPISSRALLVWNALEAGPRQWKGWLERYVQAAEGENRGGGFEFLESASANETLERISKARGLANDMLDAARTPPGDRSATSYPSQANDAMSDPDGPTSTPRNDHDGGTHSNDTDPSTTAAEPSWGSENETLTCRLVSLNDLAKITVPPLPWSPFWKPFMGQTPMKFWMSVYGKWGEGKTSFITRFAGEVSRFGRTIIAENEEDLGAGMVSERIRLLGVRSDQVEFTNDADLDRIERTLTTGNFRFAFFDSISFMLKQPGIDVDRLVGLPKKFPNISFIYVIFGVKAGETFKGDSIFGYAPDIVVQVKDLVARAEKNKYGNTNIPFTILRRP